MTLLSFLSADAMSYAVGRARMMRLTGLVHVTVHSYRGLHGASDANADAAAGFHFVTPATASTIVGVDGEFSLVHSVPPGRFAGSGSFSLLFRRR